MMSGNCFLCTPDSGVQTQARAWFCQIYAEGQREQKDPLGVRGTMFLGLSSHKAHIYFPSRFNRSKQCLDITLTIKTWTSYLFTSAKLQKMDSWMSGKLKRSLSSPLAFLLFCEIVCVLLDFFIFFLKQHEDAKCVSWRWRVRSGLVGHSRYTHSINPSLNMAPSQQVLANELWRHKVI